MYPWLRKFRPRLTFPSPGCESYYAYMKAFGHSSCTPHSFCWLLGIATMSSPMGFFTLSRELRDNIYYHYVFEPDGYHYDYESGKFRASGNRSIDLALTYSCKSVSDFGASISLCSSVDSELFHRLQQKCITLHLETTFFISQPSPPTDLRQPASQGSSGNSNAIREQCFNHWSSPAFNTTELQMLTLKRLPDIHNSSPYCPRCINRETSVSVRISKEAVYTLAGARQIQHSGPFKTS